MTATSGEMGKIQFESPPAEIPGLVKSSGVAIDQMETPAPVAPKQATPPTPPIRERISPALNIQPVVVKAVRQWGLIVALAVWVALTAPLREGVLVAVGLLVASGLLRMFIDFRVARGAVSQRGGMAIVNLSLLTAVSFAGVVGATLVSPVVLLIPALVWSLSAVAHKPWISNLGTRLAILVTAGISVLSASSYAAAPTTISSTIGLGAAIVFAIMIASVHGRQSGPKLLQKSIDDTPSGSATADEDPLTSVRLAIASQSDPTGIARIAARAMSERLEPGYVAIVESVPHDNMFHLLSEVVGDANAVGLGRRLAGVTESAVSRGAPIWMMDDADDTFTLTCRRLGIQAALIVPLEHLSHRIGAIQIAWLKPVGPVQLSEALAFANEIAAMITPDLAIAQFASEIERGYFDAISSLAAKVDDRDDFTRGHSRRVAKHALTIAEALDLDETQQRMLLYAAELHDIGRIGVSEQIFSKTGALSAEEWAQIRSYPRISADIVEPLSFFSDVREVVLHQNERWDGKGYPDRLAGADIPLLSRILTVADAYDAMTSPRAYRSAMSSQQALTELWKARGAKFDPEIVESFVMSGTIRQRIA
jgi:hypothetical protein